MLHYWYRKISPLCWRCHQSNQRQPDEEGAEILQLPSCWKVHHPKVVSSLWTAVPLILDKGLNHFNRTLLCSRVGSLPPARIWTAYSISSRKGARLMPKPVLKHFWDQKIIRIFPSLLICTLQWFLHGVTLVLKVWRVCIFFNPQDLIWTSSWQWEYFGDVGH